MKRPSVSLRVLLVEDSENDALLLLRELGRGGYEPVYERVSTPEEMERALEAASAGGEPWQVVISDYYMPRFRAPDALALLRKLGYDTPFIVVSGKIGEDAAVEMMRSGAQDYVTKENMTRLCPAIERELREAKERRERRRAGEALRFLSEASAELFSSLDYHGTLAGLARVVVSYLADWCAVDVLEADGSTRRVAVGHRDPAKVSLALKLEEHYPSSRDAPSGIPYVLRTGRSEFYPDITGVMLEATARDEEHLRILREIGFTSVIIVPMIARGRILGAITLVWAESGRHYGEADLELAEELARRAALAVDNARLYDGAQREIAERERAEEELRDSIDQLEIILRGVADGITAQDPSGHLVYANEAAARVAGYPTAQAFLKAPVEEVMQKFEVADESGRPLAPDELPGRKALRGEEAQALLRFREAATDEERWSVVSATPIFDEHGRVRFAVSIFRDITESRRTEEALRQSEELYRTVVEQAAENIFLVDVETKRILESNAALHRSLGYAPEELKEMTLYDIVAHDRESVDQNTERILEQGHCFLGERSYRRKDGSLVDVEVSASTVPYHSGEVMCIVAHNVSERKKAEEERARLAAIVESSDDPIFGKTLDGIITSWNRGAEQLYGYSVEEAVGQPVSMLVPPDRPDEVPEILRKVRRGEKVEHLETVRVRKDGRRLDVSLTVSPIRDPEGNIVGASSIARDITERKRAEEALREARATERNRIARDLHDDILQDIAYALQEIQIVQVMSEEGAAPALDEAAEALRRSVDGLRGAIFELRMRDTLGQSFVSSLEALLELNRRRVRSRYELEMTVDDGFPQTLSETAGREVVRIIQEALTNVRRHAQARHVRVRLWREGDLARVEVADDGRGFDAENPRAGMGQHSMRHRASELGGELEVESAPGRGTRVRFGAPISHLIEG